MVFFVDNKQREQQQQQHGQCQDYSNHNNEMNLIEENFQNIIYYE